MAIKVIGDKPVRTRKHVCESKHITRCWVVGHTNQSREYGMIYPALPFTSLDFAWVEVPDRNGDIAGYAANLGVTDVEACVR
jgi:hypothetical protein